MGVFKYTGFFLSNVQALLGVPEVIPAITLPIGISFYTFQLISYIIDVYRGEVEPQKKFWLLQLYASLFHQVHSGPHRALQRRQRGAGKPPRHPRGCGEGLSRFACGLAKKAILANGCAAIVSEMVLFLNNLMATGGDYTVRCPEKLVD